MKSLFDVLFPRRVLPEYRFTINRDFCKHLRRGDKLLQANEVNYYIVLDDVVSEEDYLRVWCSYRQKVLFPEYRAINFAACRWGGEDMLSEVPNEVSI